MTWQELKREGLTEYPAAREMHSTCSHGSSMLIAGGRSSSGDILSDVWQLTLCSDDGAGEEKTADIAAADEDKAASSSDPPLPAAANEALIFTLTSSSSTSQSTEGIQVSAVAGGYVPSPALAKGSDLTETGRSRSSAMVPLRWRRRRDLELPSPRCAHGSALLARRSAAGSAAASSEPLDMLLFGGFTESGVAGDFLVCPFTAQGPTTGAIASVSNWKQLSCGSGGRGGGSGPAARFGHCMTSISGRALKRLMSSRRYEPVFSAAAKEAAQFWLQRESEPESESEGCPALPAAALLFGGVSELSDFGDIWLIQLT